MEKRGRLPGQLTGRSPYLQPVQVMAPESLIGQMVAVTITAIGTNSLFGTLADSRREFSDGRKCDNRSRSMQNHLVSRPEPELIAQSAD